MAVRVHKSSNKMDFDKVIKSEVAEVILYRKNNLLWCKRSTTIDGQPFEIIIIYDNNLGLKRHWMENDTWLK